MMRSRILRNVGYCRRAGGGAVTNGQGGCHQTLLTHSIEAEQLAQLC